MKLSSILTLAGGLLTIGGIVTGKVSENKLKDEIDVDEMEEIDIDDFEEIEEEA